MEKGHDGIFNTELDFTPRSASFIISNISCLSLDISYTTKIHVHEESLCIMSHGERHVHLMSQVSNGVHCLVNYW